jgi:hypothetical protein
MSLSYNPNVDVSYHQQYDQSSNAMNFPRDGNFKPIDSFNNSYQAPMMMQQPMMTPMAQPMMQMPMQQQMMMPSAQPIMPQMYNPNVVVPKQNRKVKEKFAEPVEKPNKINWTVVLKKIVIYTMLFLIMSHVKMNELIFKILPILEMHEIVLMILKGFLMSLVVIIIQIFL